MKANVSAACGRSIVALLLILPFSLAQAHEAVSEQYGSFLGGLSHPVLGLDHLLAMVSVGIVSAQIGGRAIWLVPATFVAVMAFGGLAGIFGLSMGATEIGISLSVMLLGLAIAADKKIPLLVVMAAVGFFAVFHGYAHGVEMPEVANPATYAGGFMTGTAALHLFGVLIGDISQRYVRGKKILRFAGASIAGIGTFFLTTLAV